jgi:K+-transporting ATPase, c chain
MKILIDNKSPAAKVELAILISTKKMVKKFTKLKAISPSLRIVLLMLVVTGIAYPLVLVAIGQSILPFQSNGSILTFDGKSIGSKLISQDFKKFFHSRRLLLTKPFLRSQTLVDLLEFHKTP